MRRTRNRRKEGGSRSDDRGSKVRFKYVEVPEGRGQLKMKVAPMVKLGGSMDPRVNLNTARWGAVLGLIGLGFVLNLWFGALMTVVCQLLDWDPVFWSKWTSISFVVGLYGVHLFGVAGTHLSRGYRSWGVVAIASFWIGVLGWIPIGLLINWLS